MQPILTSFIPKSKLLACCLGIIISCLTTILCPLPFQILKGKVAVVYFVIVYLCMPIFIGIITTAALGYHKQSSTIASILFSQLALIISFISLALTLPPNIGYLGAFLIMYFPLLMVFTAMGTMIGCELLLIDVTQIKK